MAMRRGAAIALQVGAALCAFSVAAYLSDLSGVAPNFITASAAWQYGRYAVFAVLLTIFTGFLYAGLRKISVSDLTKFSKSLAETLVDYFTSIVGLGGAGIPSGLIELRFAEQKIRQRNVSLSAQTESKIIQIFEDALGGGLSDEISSAFESIIEKKLSSELRLRSSESLSLVASRLEQAVRTVSTRGFFNLAIGIAFAVTALFILKAAVSLFSPAQLAGLSIAQSLYIMGMRISLALVITLIAYFFLSLYSKSLDDVKYYQNELRMVGLKLASLNVAYDCDGDEARKILVEHLAKSGNSLAADDDNSRETLQGVGKLLEKVLDKLPSMKGE